MTLSEVDSAGFAVIPAVLSAAETSDAIACLESAHSPFANSRRFLDFAWCRRIAVHILRNPSIHDVLPDDALAIQCTLFDKAAENNWLVALHQDRSVPVRERVDHVALGAWSEKEGQLHVQAPDALLERLVAVRVSLDDCDERNGALRVVAGSHRHGRLDPERARKLRDRFGETVCAVNAGDAMLMRPLLLHASSKVTSSRRRVLHFVFAPSSPGYGLAWPTQLN